MVVQAEKIVAKQGQLDPSEVEDIEDLQQQHGECEKKKEKLVVSF